MQNAQSNAQVTLTVAPSGSDYTSIQAAIDAAPEGSTIAISAGTYREALMIKKEVHLIGVGDRKYTIIDSDDKNSMTIIFNAQRGSIKNLTLKYSFSSSDMLEGFMGAFLADLEAPEGSEADKMSDRLKAIMCVVNIRAGELLLEGCDVTSDSKMIIGIRGGANPIIKNNRVHGGEGQGIAVYDYASGVIEENVIYNNGHAGIMIVNKSKPVVNKNVIRDGKGYGILVDLEGNGLIEENEIYGNTFANVAMVAPENYVE